MQLLYNLFFSFTYGGRQIDMTSEEFEDTKVVTKDFNVNKPPY